MKSTKQRKPDSADVEQARYVGPLAEPIIATRVEGLLDEPVREEALRQLDAMLAKLPLLAAAHGVAPDDFFALALALARAHVPGFKVVSKAGHPEVWSEFEKAQLKLEVNAHRDGGKTRKRAIEAVLAEGRWQHKRPTFSALETHYKRADGDIVAIVRDAHAYRLLNR